MNNNLKKTHHNNEEKKLLEKNYIKKICTKDNNKKVQQKVTRNTFGKVTKKTKFASIESRVEYMVIFFGNVRCRFNIAEMHTLEFVPLCMPHLFAHDFCRQVQDPSFVFLHCSLQHRHQIFFESKKNRIQLPKMFWCIQIGPNQSETVQFDNPTKITYCVLDINSVTEYDATVSQIILNLSTGRKFLLANITPSAPHVISKIVLKDKVKFENLGNGIVHVAGYAEELETVNLVGSSESSSDSDPSSSSSSEDESVGFIRKKIDEKFDTERTPKRRRVESPKKIKKEKKEKKPKNHGSN